MTITEILAKDNVCSRLLAKFEERYGPVRVREKAWWVPTPPRFTTTFWRTIHWARGREYDRPEDALGTLAHELQHVVQFTKRPVAMPLLYLMPQLLAVLCLFGLLWWPLWCFALLALPWPSPTRVRYEVEGYVTGSTPSLRIVEVLTSWSYYRASWSASAVWTAVMLQRQGWTEVEGLKKEVR